MEKNQDIAVIIVTHNRVGDLLRTLQHLHKLPENPEIILIDNASSDGTSEKTHRTFPEVKILRLRENRGAVARNEGLRLTRRPYVAFSDDDSWWEKGALAKAIQYFRTFPDLGLIAARILVGPGQKPDPTCLWMERGLIPSQTGIPGVPVMGFIACGAIVRRTAFLTAGGFHSRFQTGGEEQLLALDLMTHGWHVRYFDDIIARHFPSECRDKNRRCRTEVRNALWTAWLRRPLSSVLRKTASYACRTLYDANVRDGFWEAVSGLHWIPAARRPVPRGIEMNLRRIGS